jgi:hypothetical protein
MFYSIICDDYCNVEPNLGKKLCQKIACSKTIVKYAIPQFRMAKPYRIARAKIQFRMVGDFHEYQTCIILDELIVLENHLNGSNVQFWQFPRH